MPTMLDPQRYGKLVDFVLVENQKDCERGRVGSTAAFLRRLTAAFPDITGLIGGVHAPK